jgi:hypothetical protein
MKQPDDWVNKEMKRPKRNGLDELDELIANLPDEETATPTAMEKLAATWTMDRSVDDQNAPYFNRVVNLAWHHSTDDQITNGAREWLLSNQGLALGEEEIIDPINLESLVKIVATQIAAYRTGIMTHGYWLTPEFWERNKDYNLDESGKLRKNLDVYLDTLCVMFGRVNQSQPFEKFITKDRRHKLINGGSIDHREVCDFVTDSYEARDRVAQLVLKQWEQLQCRTLLLRPAQGIRKQVKQNYKKILRYFSDEIEDLEVEGKRGRKLSAKEIADHWAALKLGGGKDARAIEFDRQRLGLTYDKSEEGRLKRKAHRARISRSREFLEAATIDA